jgi:hypothetical protein
MSLHAIIKKMCSKSAGVCLSGKLSSDKLYKKWFLGSDAVEWLVNQSMEFPLSKEEAISLANRLLEAQFIQPASKPSPKNFRLDTPYFFTIEPDSEFEPPPPLLPKTTENLSFLDIPAIEFARQVSLSEHHIFCRVKQREFIKQAWKHPNGSTLAPNLFVLIEKRKHLRLWAMSEIVLTPTTKVQHPLLSSFLPQLALLTLSSCSCIFSDKSCGDCSYGSNRRGLSQDIEFQRSRSPR